MTGQKVKEGQHTPRTMWTAEHGDDNIISLKEVPAFDTKDFLKEYLDKLKIVYRE